VVVADTSLRTHTRGYGTVGGQLTLAVPTMRAKALAQRDGLGVGWLPRVRVAGLIDSGQLVERQVAMPREPNQLYAGWRGDRDGRGLNWWLDTLQNGTLGARLVQGYDGFGAKSRA